MRKLFCLFCLFCLICSTNALAGLTLSSPDVTNDHTFKNQQLFNQWGCTGGNTSPVLNWEHVPKGTKSFAITLYDPDAPTGSGWWHWLVINIDPATRTLVGNAGNLKAPQLPDGARMITNDFGFPGYGGACPPEGAEPHQYELTLYALDTDMITIPEHASGALAGYYILQHVIEKSVLVAPTNDR